MIVHVPIHSEIKLIAKELFSLKIKNSCQLLQGTFSEHSSLFISGYSDLGMRPELQLQGPPNNSFFWKML